MKRGKALLQHSPVMVYPVAVGLLGSVAIISAAIADASKVVDGTVEQRERRVAPTEASIGRVLSELRGITDALERSSSMLKGDGVSIQSEFQAQLEKYRATHQLDCLDPETLLADLKKSYVMADQHMVHQGAKVEQKSTEISFF